MAENLTNSNKDSNKFSSAVIIIANALLKNFREVTHLQADFYTRSSNTSRIASIDISSSSATTYSDERLGLDLPSNQSAQVPAESPDISASRPSDKSKNNSFSAVKSMSIYADFASFDCIVRGALRHAFDFFVLRFQPLTEHLRQWDFVLLGNSFKAISLHFIQSNFIYLFPSHSALCPQKGYNRFSIAERGSPPADNRTGDGRLYLTKSHRANTYEYNTFVGASCTPCITLRSYADMGGIA